MYETQGPPPGNGSGASLEPAFRCETSGDGGRVLVALGGELDLASAPELLRQLQLVLARPITTVTVDLTELTFIDSSGVGVLCHVLQDAQDQGVQLELEQVPDHARRVLEITGLTETFNLGERPA